MTTDAWSEPDEEFTQQERERGRVLFDALEEMHHAGRKGEMDALARSLNQMTPDQLQGALILAINALDLDELHQGRRVLLGDAA